MSEQFVPAPVRVSPAYEKLAGVIRERIMTGELKAGDRVPSEVRLAEEARVSRSTVREALRMLQEAGFVERTSPRIMIVRPDTGESRHHELLRALRRRNVTFHHLYEALRTIEPELSRLAAGRRTEADLEALHGNLAEQEESLDAYPAWNRLDEGFHLAIGRASGNRTMITARAPIGQLLLPTSDRFVDSRHMTEIATGFHRRILAAISDGDGEAAALVTRRHIEDFRAAWEAEGLDFHLQIGALIDGSAPPPGGPPPPTPPASRPRGGG
jgi:GntR family transcriptional regulator, transcriptional repressor for pyruvate dehydrogenase complex